MGAIYALIDPEGLDVRYVGQTRLDPQERFEAHMATTRLATPSKQPVHKWLRSLGGKKPLLRVLENNPKDLYQAERKWIAVYRQLNPDRMLNLADGGPGVVGPYVSRGGNKWSPEAREAFSQRKKGQGPSLVTRQAVSAAKKGKPASEETKAKMRATHQARYANMTPEQRAELTAKISVGKTGKAQPNWRGPEDYGPINEKRAITWQGKSDDEKKAIADKRWQTRRARNV